MNRPRGVRKPCDAVRARRRLEDARQFLEAADLLEAPDVVATNAIHAAIAASDAIVCRIEKVRSGDGNHSAAADAADCVRWARVLVLAAEERVTA